MVNKLSKSDGATSPTLLSRLRHSPSDQAAWDEFVERYSPRIYGWCRRWNLQEADAQDVTQDVLLRLADKMRTFVYDPSGSFRGWLKTLAHHAWHDFVKKRERAGPGSGDSSILDKLDAVEARADLLLRLDEEFDRELLDEAQARVRQRVKPHIWEAFRLLALEGCSGAQAAARLQIKVSAVFVARSAGGAAHAARSSADPRRGQSQNCRPHARGWRASAELTPCCSAGIMTHRTGLSRPESLPPDGTACRGCVWELDTPMCRQANRLP